jgi:hypothetical protein
MQGGGQGGMVGNLIGMAAAAAGQHHGSAQQGGSGTGGGHSGLAGTLIGMAAAAANQHNASHGGSGTGTGRDVTFTLPMTFHTVIYCLFGCNPCKSTLYDTVMVTSLRTGGGHSGLASTLIGMATAAAAGHGAPSPAPYDAQQNQYGQQAQQQGYAPPAHGTPQQQGHAAAPHGAQQQQGNPHPAGEAKKAFGVLITGCQAHETSADACPSGDPSKAFGEFPSIMQT